MINLIAKTTDELTELFFRVKNRIEYRNACNLDDASTDEALLGDIDAELASRGFRL